MATLTASLAVLLAACGGMAGSGPHAVPSNADALLLTPADLPEASVRQAQQFAERETRGGGQTAQVIFEQNGQNGTRIFQSVVIFPSEQIAQTALESVRQGGPGALWEEVPSAPTFGQESVVFRARHDSRDALLVIFRQGRVLERITFIGTDDLARFGPLVRKAVEKAIGGGKR